MIALVSIFLIPYWYSPQINFVVTSASNPPSLEKLSGTMRINKAIEEGEFLDYFLMGRKTLEEYPEIKDAIEDPDFTEMALVNNELIPLLETNVSEIKTETILFDEIGLTWYKAENMAAPGKFIIETSNVNIEIETRTSVFFDVILRRLVDNAIDLGLVEKKDREFMVKPYCDQFSWAIRRHSTNL
jgi:hypothetical protein